MPRHRLGNPVCTQLGERTIGSKREIVTRDRWSGVTQRLYRGGVFVKADEGVVIQRFERLRLAVPRQVVAVRIEANIDVANASRDQGVLGRSSAADGNVGIVTQEILGPIGEGKLDNDSWVFPAKVSENWR